MALNHEGMSERIGEDDARRLLIRAVEIDTTMGSMLTLDQLREVALEVGVQPDAFNAAIAERHVGEETAASLLPPSDAYERVVAKWWTPQHRNSLTRGAIALAAGLVAVNLSHGLVQAIDSSWLAEKAADPLALAAAAVVAMRLRARPIAVLSAGLAVSQGAEFLFDWINGAPAVHGLYPHLALMAAGLAASVLISWRMRRPPAEAPVSRHDESVVSTRVRRWSGYAFAMGVVPTAR